MSKRKHFYPIEEQINDCFDFLGKPHKDAFEMDEAEISMVEAELRKSFCWVKHPDYAVLIPKHIESGTLIEQ